MNVEVCIPHQGLTTETVTIVKWYKSVGDEVKEKEILFSTESEKAVLEVESPAAGTLIEILVTEDNEAEIGQTVALIKLNNKD